MQIAITGHTGFLGTALKEFFSKQGYQVTGIGRDDFRKGTGHLSQLLTGKYAVINLAGAPVMKRWTKKYGKQLWNSRTMTTKALVHAMENVRGKPGVFISASAVGIYAEKGIHNETSNDFDMGFLGTLCQEWEKEARKAKLVVNTYIIRIGVVLDNNGGALPKMAAPFRMGVGGKIGSGLQVISWIHIEDFCDALLFLIVKRPIQEIFNFTSPNPVSNAMLSGTIASILKRPNFFTVPSFALKLLFGEGATVLLNGQNVVPENLLGSGFQFKFTEIGPALKDLL